MISWNLYFCNVLPQIREQMCLETHFHFWVVLDSRCCREKKIQTAISMQLWRPFFLCFMGKKIFALKKIKNRLPVEFQISM